MLKMVKSSVVKKQIMGLSGLLLCGFAVSHLAGNLLIIVSAKAFNSYANALTTNPFIYLAEAGLLAIFLTHMFLGIKLQIENRAARPDKYYSRKHSGRGATFSSSTMAYTGITLMVYLIFHIWHLKYGTHYTVVYEGVEMRDLSKLLLEYFSNPLSVLFYIVGMSAFGIHISHGFWSAFQSLGFNHAKYTVIMQRTAKAFGFFIALGFSIIPIWAYLQGVN